MPDNGITAETELAHWLSRQERRELLRFITCGSVDDGKSTLIGHLLCATGSIFDDQLAALAEDSRKIGTQDGNIDFALLLDGLTAEREQGITIDVAYRFFSTDRRKFIVADTPGHEQYTRNMVTGASTAEAAIILVDARKGILPQTLRHSTIVSLLGVRHIVLAVNKMDLIGYSEERFHAIEAQFRATAAKLNLGDVTCIPVSAVKGDNIVEAGVGTPWYQGPTILAYLEAVEVDQYHLVRQPLRLPIQWVNRPDQDFRGFAGTLASGRLRKGERITALPSCRQSTVARIVTFDGDLDEAVAGQSVTVTLADEIDISRGDVLTAANAPAEIADQFEATMIWMGDEPMLPGRPYWLKTGAKTANAAFGQLKYKINVETMEHLAARQLELNDIAVCNLSLDQPIPFDRYADNRETGSFIIIDKVSNNTVGAGLIDFALRRSHNIHWQPVDVDKARRAAIKGQQARAVWFTGLSGAGKSTIANLVETKLHALGRHTYLLDGDNVRHGLNRDLGFTEADRVENIRRVAEVAKLMVDAGLIVLVCFISPFRAERQMARQMFEPGEFLEVFVDAPLTVTEQRDPKGLYRKARRGELKNFTGIDSPYEPPENAELRLDTTELTADDAAERVVKRIG